MNAQKFDAAFYACPDLRETAAQRKKPELDINSLMEQLQSSPELAAAFSKLINAQNAS